MNNKKTIWIIALVLSLGMVIPFASAYNIQYFMEDMEANPSNYYILHTRAEPELTSHIQSFADNFGIQVSNVEIPSKNVIAIAFEDDEVINEDVWPYTVSYAEFYGDVEMSLAIWITMERGFSKNSADIANELEAYAYNLDIILNHLSNYQASPIDDIDFTVAYGIVVEKRMPTCSEFALYDGDFYFRDMVYWYGEVMEDFCVDDILMELECTGTDMEYVPYICDKGCAHGFCIYSVFWLMEEQFAERMNYPDFAEGINAWIDMP